MWRSPRNRFDVATALADGGRDYQEDSLLADFPVGRDLGYGVLADGMGGHAAGDTASTLVVAEAYRELALRKTAFARSAAAVPEALRNAALAANCAVERHVATHPKSSGMGATLLATVLVGPQLYWVSIGDSLLYLHRGRKLGRLNEDHSMAAQIDAMVALGQIKPEIARSHPDRSCLTSAIMGRKIARMNCPADPVILQTGDILVMASDGLLSLPEESLEQALRRNGKRTSQEIAEALVDAVREENVEDQDNLSIVVIKVLHDRPLAQTARPVAAALDPRQSPRGDGLEVFDAVDLDEDASPAPARRAVGL